MQKFKPTATFYSVALLIILWQGLAMLINYPDLFPSVIGLLATLAEMFASKIFYVALCHTLYRGLIGFFIAFVLAISLSAIALNSHFIKAFIHPWIVISRSIPVISLVLIALLWLSPPGLPIFIAFFTMFPILYQNFLSGLKQTDRKLVEMAKVFKKNNLQRLIYLFIPSAHAYAFSGMATAMGFGWRSVIIGEVLAGPVYGIGTGMKRAQAFIDMKTLLAWTVIAVLISFIFDYVLKFIAKKPIRFKLKKVSENKQSPMLNTDTKELVVTLLNKKFNTNQIIYNLSMHLNNQNINLLQTPSGSGKTTLMKLIAGILKADSGSITSDPAFPVISFSYQDIRLIPWFTVEQNMAFALPGFPNITQNESLKIDTLIHEMGLEAHRDKLPDELSGGEQQRVNLARALMLPCHILLLDEPLNGIESAFRKRLIKFTEDWTASYKPLILWATHMEVEAHLAGTVRKIEC
jgi:ABC-type nitrate/sulfonate/bicarbonate transport system permease component/ABC-type nitrate/sulfonate/bicarbonate transport system ATPase subunit